MSQELQTKFLAISKERQIPKSHVDYLRKLKAGGFEPKVVYDIGTNYLHWTHEVEELWPDAEIILFEAFDKLEFLYKDGGYTYHIGLLSKEDDKELNFYYSDEWPGGNSYYKEYNDKVFPSNRFITMKSSRLDTIVQTLGLPPPDLVKIDVQGAELDVFKGGVESIGKATHLISSFQTSYYNLGAPLAKECLPIVEKHGWKCIAPLFCNNGPNGDYGFLRTDSSQKEDTRPTMCLNMIVKDEAHIIADTLKMLCDKIQFDYWVICDTGSTDNTPQIITDFFNRRGIPGELRRDTWENFAHNRTLALEYAYNKTDLLLVFDADDELHGTITIPEKVLYDEYKFKFGTAGSSSYTRTLMINNRKKFKYLSVIHEFITYQDEGSGTSTILEGDYHVISGRRGNRSKNPNKYLDDALILEKAHAEAIKANDPLYKRYSFYCANSYKDAGKPEEAIKWYKITLRQDNWCQEKYVSCLNLYDCYASIQQREAGFYYLVEAFKYDSERIECLNHLLIHYCNSGQSSMAYSYFCQVKQLYDRIHRNDTTLCLEDKLFGNINNYYFYVPYIMIIICDHTREHKIGIQMYEIIFDRKSPVFSEFHIKNILFNLQFYIKHIESAGLMASFVERMNSYLAFLRENNYIQTGIDVVLERYKVYGMKTEYILPSVCKRTVKFSKEECTNTQNILFFTGFTDTPWNRSHMDTHSLGGSEKAVIYLSEILAINGYNVYVSGNMKEETTANGVKYIHMNNLSDDIPFHTVIISRYLFFLEKYLTISFGKLVIWAHDTHLLPYGTRFVNSEDIIRIWDKYIDKCICLSEWHREKYISIYPQLANKIHIINNGIQLSKIRGEHMLVKQKHKFVYTSCSERGLDILLSLWPSILQEWPDAELTISSYNPFPKSPEDEKMQQIIQKYPYSIHHLGKLSSTELYEQIRSAEFWLYPCTFYETSCITAMEMLAGEVICLYYPIGGLISTMSDCGIQISRGNELQTLFSLTEEQKMSMRQKGLEYVSTCTWEHRAADWMVDIIL